MKAALPPNCSSRLILHPLGWAVAVCTVAWRGYANTTPPDGRTGVGQGPVEQSRGPRQTAWPAEANLAAY